MASLVQTGHSLAEQRELIKRVTESDLFQRSPRLRELLLYVSECTIQGRLGDVREQVIAERVFGRGLDPGGQDSIVRAEARNLRKRLETYFATEGADEPVLLVVPKGRYSVAFVARSQNGQLERTEEDAADLPTTSPAPKQETITSPPLTPPVPVIIQTPRRIPWAAWTCAVFAIAALAFALYWRQQVITVRQHLDLSRPSLPFSAIFNESDPAEIVTSDTGFLQIAAVMHRRITLDEYVARSYPSESLTKPESLMRDWNLYEYTDGREMTIAGLILRRNAEYAEKTSLSSGHAVQLQDFKDHNMVLIGSPISNPWAQLYEGKVNFRCEYSESDGRIFFRDKYPRANAQSVFPDDNDRAQHRTYARIVFLPKTSDAGATLLIAGTTAQSTQAAGELVTDQQALHATLRSLGIDPFGPPRYFELMIRSNYFVGGAILREVVATRVSSAPEK